MAELDCARLREVGPELALGVLAGRDRALARLGVTHRRRWRRWVGATAAVLVAVALAAGGWALHSAPHNDHDLATATLTAAGGARVGEVFAYSDQRPWLYVDLSSPQAHGTVTCLVQLADGRAITVGSFPVTAGSAQWAG